MTSRIDLLWRRHRALVLIGSALIGITAAAAIVWPITDLIAAHDVGTIVGPSRAFHLQTAREAVRTQMLTLGAGLFAIAALIYTARNYRAGAANTRVDGARPSDRPLHEGHRANRLRQARRAHRRYLCLGTHRPRLARDHPTVMEVLTAFIREHSREQWPLAQLGADAPERVTRPDVQAAITVIGRRNRTHDLGYINLRESEPQRS